MVACLFTTVYKFTYTKYRQKVNGNVDCIVLHKAEYSYP